MPASWIAVFTIRALLLQLSTMFADAFVSLNQRQQNPQEASRKWNRLRFRAMQPVGYLSNNNLNIRGTILSSEPILTQHRRQHQSQERNTLFHHQQLQPSHDAAEEIKKQQPVIGRIRRLLLLRHQSRILRILPLAATAVSLLFASLGAFPSHAATAKTPAASIAASAATAILSSFSSFSHPRPRRRDVLIWLTGVVWLSWTVVQALLLHRRQAKDATSEWGRYARHPSARGRAVANLLLLKLLPLYLLSRLIPSRLDNMRQALLSRSGTIFADGLLKLGPLYIKLGQIVSCRENFLPEQYKVSMERLQDQVPSRTGQDALVLAYAAWPAGPDDFEETFSDFDTTPLAAASLGQVHTATLASTNETVAIKLQRPYLREIYDQDLALLNKIAATVDRFGGAAGQVGGISQSWVEIFEDAEEILYREIDYRDEAASEMRFCNDFGLDKGGREGKTSARSRDGKLLPSAARWLRAPYVYKDLSSEKVLVMEYVPSIKITNNDKLDAANVTLEQKMYLADMLGRSYLRQFCCNLFFSTDPHPGNLGVEILNPNDTNPESRVRLVFYDFGQVASLTQTQADGILSIIEAIVDSDVDQSIVAFQQMGVLKDGANLDKVRAKVADNYKTGKVKANRRRLERRGYKVKQSKKSSSNSTASNTTSASDTEVMSFFTLPAEYAFVGRALSQMDGVGKSLDAEFDFVSSAAPWMVEIKGAGKYLREEAKKWVKKWYSFQDGMFLHLGDGLLPHYVDEPAKKRERNRKS